MKEIFKARVQTVLTSTDKYILELINNNIKKFIDLNLTRFAIEFKVSLSSLSRIARKMNFINYNDMRIYASSNQKISTKNKNENEKEIEGKYQNVIIDIYKETTEINRDILHKEEIKKATKLLINSNNIAIFGSGTSSLIANHLSHSLTRFNIKSENFQNIHDIIPKLAYYQEDSLFILFSKSLISKEIKWILNKAIKKNIKIICITANKDVLKMKITLPIIYKNIPHKDRHFSISSKIANLLIIDNILYSISKEKINLKNRLVFDKLIEDWNIK